MMKTAAATVTIRLLILSIECSYGFNVFPTSHFHSKGSTTVNRFNEPAQHGQNGISSFLIPSPQPTPPPPPPSSSLSLSSSSSLEEDNNKSSDEIAVPPFVESVVLKQVYPAMMKHIAEFGNPNIPLGSTDGKRCKTLRRLAFENKLTEEEIALLNDIKFRLNSLEEVYDEADFDDCLERLFVYEKEHKNNYQIPKKYNLDPELGAWVTMIRRIGIDNIEPERRKKLTNIDFSWVSTRKCGSAFMSTYRPLINRLLEYCTITDDMTEVVDEKGLQEILKEPDVLKWIRAQAASAKNGKFSEARCDYMDQLPGFNWREL